MNQLQFLLLGSESGRNKGNLAWASMTIDLISKGDMTWGEALVGYRTNPYKGGAYPMSMVSGKGGGPESASAELKRERDQGSPVAERSAAAHELANREIDLAIRWLRVKMNEERPMFHSRDLAKELIKKEILKFFKLK
jgi:hypothetical protein